jgi:2-methylcitrate dehydratase PrpD
MLHTMGEPLALKQASRSAYEAKFSGPYTVASALIGGGGLGLGIEDFTDALVDEPRRRELMARVSVRADARCDAVFPDQAPAILSVLTTSGETLVESVMVNRGSAERPLSEAEVSAKFADNARRVLPAHAADALQAAVEALPAGGDAGAVAALLRTVTPISEGEASDRR